MTGMIAFNLFIGVWLLYIAFAPEFRPMSWTRFWINLAISFVNLGLAAYGFYRL